MCAVFCCSDLILSMNFFTGSTVLNKQDMQAMQSVLNVPTTDDHIVTQHARSNSEKTEKFGPGPSDAVGSKPEMADMKTSQGSGSGKTFYHPHPLPMPEFGGWFAPLTGMYIPYSRQ